MKTRALACTALFLGFAHAAPAQSPPNRPFYLGLDLGLAELNRDRWYAAGSEADSSSMGWKLRMGYRLSAYLAVEAAYTDFGDFEGTEVLVGPGGSLAAGLPAGASLAAPGDFTTSAKGMALAAVGEWPLGEVLHLNATVGLVRREFDTHYDSFTPGQPGSNFEDGDLGLQFGLGFGFRFGDSLDLAVEWVRTSNLEGDIEFSVNSADPSMISLGLRFNL